jgi:hypothetical protein
VSANTAAAPERSVAAATTTETLAGTPVGRERYRAWMAVTVRALPDHSGNGRETNIKRLPSGVKT